MIEAIKLLIKLFILFIWDANLDGASLLSNHYSSFTSWICLLYCFNIGKGYVVGLMLFILKKNQHKRKCCVCTKAEEYS